MPDLAASAQPEVNAIAKLKASLAQCAMSIAIVDLCNQTKLSSEITQKKNPDALGRPWVQKALTDVSYNDWCQACLVPDQI